MLLIYIIRKNSGQITILPLVNRRLYYILVFRSGSSFIFYPKYFSCIVRKISIEQKIKRWRADRWECAGAGMQMAGRLAGLIESLPFFETKETLFWSLCTHACVCVPNRYKNRYHLDNKILDNRKGSNEVLPCHCRHFLRPLVGSRP